MANPAGCPKNSTDNEIWDLPFSFTLIAAGVVSTATPPSLPREIKSIARTGNAGEYLLTLREKWVEPTGFMAQGISATVNRGQLTVNSVTSSPPTVTFVTLAESAGVQAATDLANGTKIFGTLSLRNSSVK